MPTDLGLLNHLENTTFKTTIFHSSNLHKATWLNAEELSREISANFLYAKIMGLEITVEWRKHGGFIIEVN